MDAVPPYFLLPFGCVVGVIIIAPVGRWLVFFLRATGLAPERAGGVPKGERAIPTVFATLLHPIPWAILVGTPVFIYWLLKNDHSVSFLWFFAGCVLGPVMLMLWITIVMRRAMRARQRNDTNTPHEL